MSNIIFSEGSNINNSVFGKSQEPIRMFVEKRGEDFERKSILPELFQMGTSSHWAEKFTGMTAMDGFQPVGENGAYPVDGNQESFSKVVEHMTWKDQFAVSREMVDDRKYGEMHRKSGSFTAGYYRTRERFGAAMFAAALKGNASLNFGGKSFDTRTADNVCLFSASHPSKLKASRTQSNVFSDAFSNDALMALESRMQDFRGDNNEVLDVAPNTIVIPNDHRLKKAVFEAIGSEKEPESANNGYNYNFGRWNVIVWQYLNQFIGEGTAPWMLLDQRYNEDYGGAVWLDRVKLEIRSEIDSGTDANVWHGYARFGVGFNDWRFVAAGGVSGASALLN